MYYAAPARLVKSVTSPVGWPPPPGAYEEALVYMRARARARGQGRTLRIRWRARIPPAHVRHEEAVEFFYPFDVRLLIRRVFEALPRATHGVSRG